MKRIRAIAMIVFGVMMIMPIWSYANFAETFSQKTAFIGFALGSTLDQSVQAVTDVARSTYHATKRQHHNFQLSISNFQSILNDAISQTQNFVQRQHSMLMQAKNHLMSRLSSVAQGAKEDGHQMLRLSAKVLATTESLFNLQASLSKQFANVKQSVSSLITPSNLPYVKGEEQQQNPPLRVRGARGVMEKTEGIIETTESERVSPTLIERVIERVTTVKEVLTPTIASSDSRVNKLITDVADLTTRVDEKDGSPYRNSALFNMISQSQRIKTLDDVKITNATIEGYAQSSSLSNYLPLTGGTLTGGLTGTTLTLSGLTILVGINASGVLNASSTAHITGRLSLGENLTFSATSATTTIPSSLRNAFSFATTSAPTPFLTFDTSNYRLGIGTTSPGRMFSVKGNLLANGLNLFGSGTSTIAGRLEITASSTVGGYRICTQQNNVCPSPWSSSGGLTTLSTATDLVGLGTSTPSEKLSVNGGVYFDSDIIRYGSSSAPTLNFRYFASSTSTIPNLTSAFTFATSTTNTPLLTLSTKSSRYGLVGIGTSSPSALLAIQALNATGVPRNFFYVGSSTQNTFVIDNHGNLGIGTSSPRSLLTIEGGLGAYFTSSGLLGLGTTTPWKSSTLSIEQNGVNPLLTLGDTGTSSPFFMVTAKGVISFGSTSPVLLSPSDLVIGRNGVTNDAYISGGLGIGNATTTDGILETSGLAYIGGLLKVKSTSTSTFAGPVELTATSTLLGSKLCTAKNGICTRTIRKTSDETVNNSATLQNDDELFLPMAANETWYFYTAIAHVGNATADIKFTFTVPSGATIRWSCGDIKLETGGTVSNCETVTTSGSIINTDGATNGRHISLVGIVVNGGTAGNLQLQWAQDTATAVDTKVLTNSYLEAHK